MVLAISKGWKCCETCEHWGGCRHLTAIGLVADSLHSNRTVECHLETARRISDPSLCPNYTKWHKLAGDPDGEAA